MSLPIQSTYTYIHTHTHQPPSRPPLPIVDFCTTTLAKTILFRLGMSLPLPPPIKLANAIKLLLTYLQWTHCLLTDAGCHLYGRLIVLKKFYRLLNIQLSILRGRGVWGGLMGRERKSERPAIHTTFILYN